MNDFFHHLGNLLEQFSLEQNHHSIETKFLADNFLNFKFAIFPAFQLLFFSAKRFLYWLRNYYSLFHSELFPSSIPIMLTPLIIRIGLRVVDAIVVLGRFLVSILQVLVKTKYAENRKLSI